MTSINHTEELYPLTRLVDDGFLHSADVNVVTWLRDAVMTALTKRNKTHKDHTPHYTTCTSCWKWRL